MLINLLLSIFSCNNCRYLGLVAALASEADYLFIPEWPVEKGWEKNMCERLAQVLHLFLFFFSSILRILGLIFMFQNNVD